MNDSRQDQRSLVSIKIRYKSGSLQDFIERYSHDISRGGVFIKAKTPLTIGTLMKFEFQLEDRSALIHGVGRVVWRRGEEEATEASPAGMGVKFIKLDPESRNLVQQIVGASAGVSRAFEGGTERADMDSDADGLGEDRTAVRHVSEFLATALAQGDAHDATLGEAKADVDRARASSAFGTDDDDDDDGFLDEPTRVHRYDPADEEANAVRAAALGETNQPAPHPFDVDTTPPPDAEPPLRLEGDTTPTKPVAIQRPEPGSAPAKSRWLPMMLFLLALAGAAAGAFYVSQKDSQRPAVAAKAPVPAAAPVVEEAPEPPPKPVAKKSLKIRVESIPPGAVLKMNGKRVGETPVETEVVVGQKISFSTSLKRHFEDNRVLTISEDTPTLSITLRPMQYILRVKTKPAGARVNYAGRTIARTPGELTFDRVPTSRTLIVSKSGYYRQKKPVYRKDYEEQEDGIVRDMSFSLRRIPPKAAAPASPSAAAAKSSTAAGAVEDAVAPAEDVADGVADTVGNAADDAADVVEKAVEKSAEEVGSTGATKVDPPSAPAEPEPSP